MAHYFSAFDPPDSLPVGALLPGSHPFWLQAPNSDTIVICLHGWTATPFEAKPIGEAVFRRGFSAAGPLLPGHGFANLQQAKRAFTKTRYTDWLEAVRMEIRRAAERYKRVFIYGQSMGGALAMAMAVEGRVEACAVTAPAIFLGKGNERVAKWLGWTNIFRPKPVKPESFYNVFYPFESSRSLYALYRLGKYVLDQLEKISVPLLECHSQKDDAIHPKVADWIKARVAGPVRVEWFNESGHTMPLDIQGPVIAETIGDFFAALARS